MTTTEAMQRIEGYRFSALVNLASDYRTFLRILADQPECEAMLKAMKAQPVRIEVLSRLVQLARLPTEADLEHPADVALAAYLWLLSFQDSDLSQIAAAIVLDCQRCWWARKLAEQVRRGTRFHSRAGAVHTDHGNDLVTVFTAHSGTCQAQPPSLGHLSPCRGGYSVTAVASVDLFENRSSRSHRSEPLVRAAS